MDALKILFTLAALAAMWLWARTHLHDRMVRAGSAAVHVRSHAQLARGSGVACVDVGGRRLVVGYASGAQTTLIADLGEPDDAPDDVTLSPVDQFVGVVREAEGSFAQRLTQAISSARTKDSVSDFPADES